jgi:hypothetical protein
LGWLHAVPNGWNQTNMQFRVGRKMDLGLQLEPSFRYLIEAMHNLLGHVDPSKDYQIPWSEIHAFCQATGDLTEVWEKKLVKRLAERYLQSAREAKNPLCIPPVERDPQWSTSSN